MNVPRLETSRLMLRPPRRADFAAVAALWGDAEVTRFILPAPLSQEEAWARFLRAFGHWTLLGYGFWSVEEKATGRLIGETGFLDAHRDMRPPLEGLPEVGWALARAAWGQGYATEAARQVIAFGFEALDLNRIYAGYFVRNPASRRVQEKAGMRFEGIHRQNCLKSGVYEDTGLCAIIRTDWDC